MTESKNWARQQAKALKTFLKGSGIEINHGLCLEAVARMNGSANWQTFEASRDADIVIHDPNALRHVAQIALQATLFSALPETATLDSLCQSLLEAQAAEEAGEEWRAQKHRVNTIMLGAEERSFSVPPIELPGVVEEALIAITAALSTEYASSKPTPSPNMDPVVFSRSMQDWRVVEGEDLDPIDARTYQQKVTSSSYATHVSVAYPHSDVDALAEGSPQLGIGLEINKGLPCVHLYADIYNGEALLSIFAARNGELLVRFNEAATAADQHPLTEKLGLGSSSYRLR